MPSTLKHPAHIPMWRGAKVSNAIIAVCYFPIAIAGYWAYGRMVRNACYFLNNLQLFHVTFARLKKKEYPNPLFPSNLWTSLFWNGKLRRIPYFPAHRRFLSNLSLTSVSGSGRRNAEPAAETQKQLKKHTLSLSLSIRQLLFVNCIFSCCHSTFLSTACLFLVLLDFSFALAYFMSVFSCSFLTSRNSVRQRTYICLSIFFFCRFEPSKI